MKEIVLSIITLVFIAIIFYAGVGFSNDHWRKAAIENGYAHYIITNQTTGKSVWKWNNGNSEWNLK